MQGKLTEEQGELLMYIPIVEEFISESQPDRTLQDALTELIAGSNKFSMDTWKELEDLGYMGEDGQLTQDGKVFVSEQLEKEDKENAENARQQKKQWIETVVKVASSVIGSVAGEVVKKL